MAWAVSIPFVDRLREPAVFMGWGFTYDGIGWGKVLVAQVCAGGGYCYAEVLGNARDGEIVGSHNLPV